MLKKLFLANAVIILLCATSASASNYASSFGCSPKGIAMGGAMVAHVNDWSSVYYNMAGLGRTSNNDMDEGKARKNQMAVSYIYNDPDLFLDTDIPAEDLTWDKGLETGSFVLGGVLDVNVLTRAVPELLSSCRFGIMAGLNDDLSLVKINDIDLRTHNFIMYGRESQNLLVMMGMGFGFFNDMIGFGLGASPSMGGKGRIIASDLKLETDEQAPVMQTTFDFEISDNPLLFGFYLDIGKAFEVLSGLSFGLSHRQESYLYVDDFKMGALLETGEIPLQLFANMFDYYSPPTTTYGFSYQTESLLLAFDYETREWSKYKVSKTRKEEIESIMGLELPKMDDISILRFGAQYNLSEAWDVMAGYYQQESCVPGSSTTGVFNFLDNDKNVYSLGGAYHINEGNMIYELFQLNGPMTLYFSYQHQKLDKRSVKKDEAYVTDMNQDYSYGGKYNSFMVGFTYNL
jgi:hypothetical protein